MDAEILSELEGGPALLAWFEGEVPSFHDAEILRLSLDRDGAMCRLAIHTYEITREANPSGYLELVKHVVVTFELMGVSDLKLDGFNTQNVINELTITRTPDGNYLLEMAPCWGLDGSLTAQNIRITLEPGIPPKSLYGTQRGSAQPLPVSREELERIIGQAIPPCPRKP